MTNERILELLEIERSCIKRNIDHVCDRNCGYCDLVQKDEDLMELYDSVIAEYRAKNIAISEEDERMSYQT